MFVREMSREECQALVAARRLARLACCKVGQPYIVPITYAHSGNCLHCFSMPGLLPQTNCAPTDVSILVRLSPVYPESALRNASVDEWLAPRSRLVLR